MLAYLVNSQAEIKDEHVFGVQVLLDAVNFGDVDTLSVTCEMKKSRLVLLRLNVVEPRIDTARIDNHMRQGKEVSRTVPEQ